MLTLDLDSGSRSPHINIKWIFIRFSPVIGIEHKTNMSELMQVVFKPKPEPNEEPRPTYSILRS